MKWFIKLNIRDQDEIHNIILHKWKINLLRTRNQMICSLLWVTFWTEHHWWKNSKWIMNVKKSSRLLISQYTSIHPWGNWGLFQIYQSYQSYLYNGDSPYCEKHHVYWNRALIPLGRLAIRSVLNLKQRWFPPKHSNRHSIALRGVCYWSFFRERSICFIIMIISYIGLC